MKWNKRILKEGDIVTIRKNGLENYPLKNGETCSVVGEMCEYRGKQVTIKDINNYYGSIIYHMEECPAWCWVEEMFENETFK